VDERIKEWATAKQAEYIDAINKHRSISAAARALGVGVTTVKKSLRDAKKKAAIFGYCPEADMTRPVSPVHVAKGVSTFYNKDGKVTGQWVKASLDEQKREAFFRDAVAAAASEMPRLPPIGAPEHAQEALCNLFVMTDCHLGMLAWHHEGGADWDLKIAERVLTGCFEQMLTSAPQAGTCVVAQLGDWLHSDGSGGMLPVTPTHQHVLDQDGRFSKIVQASIRILRRLVDGALHRHKHVVVLMAEGNHDMASSIWLRALFKALYENEPRITVIDSELPYYVHQHGKTMLAFHHGHLKKNDQLPILFAAQFPTVWGDTSKRYAHTGHRHHVEEKEHSGMTVVQHPTLAARDAFAARGGWVAERQVTAITYHEKFGQVGRVTVVPEMLDPA
jgi:hypothetical protein